MVLGIHVKNHHLRLISLHWFRPLYTLRRSPDVTHIQSYFIKHLLKSTAIAYMANGIIKGRGAIPKQFLRKSFFQNRYILAIYSGSQMQSTKPHFLRKNIY